MTRSIGRTRQPIGKDVYKHASIGIASSCMLDSIDLINQSSQWNQRLLYSNAVHVIRNQDPSEFYMTFYETNAGIDTATWQLLNQLDWSSIVIPEMRSPVALFSKSLSRIPVVEVPGSIPGRQQFDLCSKCSTLGSNTRDTAENFSSSLLHLSYIYSAFAKCLIQPISKLLVSRDGH